MSKIRKIIIVAMCAVVILTGCNNSLFSERYTTDLSGDGEYDYRKMYITGDSGDLTDKELEAFNEASRVYSLYIDNCSSDYDKVKAAHDYIIKNCVYNKEAVDNDSLVDDDFSVYGALVKGVAVCEGYAKAFKMLMDIAGIDCIMVTGTVGEDEVLHAWNMVKLKDDWYHVDVTFDDPYPETSEIVYLYFNISDDIISKDHSWNKNVTPEADDSSYDLLINETQIATVDEFKLFIGNCSNKTVGYTSFVWTGKDMISETQWRSAINSTVIANVAFSCVGVDGRRLYMVNLSY